MEAFYGTWNQVDCTNFDEYLERIGVSPSLRKKAKTPLAMDICQDGEKVGVNIKSPHKKHQLLVKLEEEFDEITPDKRVARTTFRMEGNKLVQVQKWDGKEMRMEYEIKDGKIVMKSHHLFFESPLFLWRCIFSNTFS
ncbi:fatty acid-binding protein, brain-like [Nematolebias whitei]|uniref:fatty acid-binding protein, brain-like n=1 Tax=Nematolebias whitei TaxID=451745 RepID=UPI00189792F6|nr:fatty acid-binding protein, brain-like [Nematolebias whitei]